MLGKPESIHDSMHPFSVKPRKGEDVTLYGSYVIANVIKY